MGRWRVMVSFLYELTPTFLGAGAFVESSALPSNV